MHFIRRKLGFSSGVFVDLIGKSGGLALLWSDDVDAMIRQQRTMPWRFTGFYGSSSQTDRHHSWSLLWRLQQTSSLPWLVMGDFNEILFQHEKEGMNDRSAAAMARFQEVLLDCCLNDLDFIGPEFTWSNRRDSGLVRERLDRAVATAEWSLKFCGHRLFHLSLEHSDHLPILLTNGEVKKRDKPKWSSVSRFDPFWAKDDEVEEVILGAWKSKGALLTPETLEWQVVHVREKCASWTSKKFGSLREKITKLQKDLYSLRADSGAYTTKERALLKEIENPQLLDEEYWRQRGRVDWLTKMEKNTDYFHHKASSRRDRNSIASLRGADGVAFTDQSPIESMICDYFHTIYSSSGCSGFTLEGLQFNQLTFVQQEN